MERQQFFVPTARGMEPLLATELGELGGENIETARAGVYFSGSLEKAYRVCLWSRTASRVIMPLAKFAAPQPENLYEGVYQEKWEEHISPDGTIAVDCQVVGTTNIESRYAALKTKDAIVDRLRDRFGRRPSVRTVQPDVRINLFINGDLAQVGIDLAGDSLHRRGYRQNGSKAPLKETLAAALLLRAECCADGAAWRGSQHRVTYANTTRTVSNPSSSSRAVALAIHSWNGTLKSTSTSTCKYPI